MTAGYEILGTRVLGTITLSLLVASLSTAAPPQRGVGPDSREPDTGSAAIEEAVRLFADGAFSGAKKRLDEARKEVSSSRLLGKLHLYLGLIAASENKPDRAKEAFRKALMHAPNLTLDPQRHKPSFCRAFSAVRREVISAFNISLSHPRPRVQLFIDGRPAGNAPLRGNWVAGEHRVEARDQQGVVLASRTLAAAAGSTLNVVLSVPKLRLQRRRVAAVPNLPRGSGRTPPPPSGSTRGVYSWLTWTAAGLALLASGAAIGLGLSAQSDQEEACALLAPSDSPCASRNSLAKESSAQRYGDLSKSMSNKETWANVAWINAAIFISAGVVAFVLDLRSSGERQRPTLSLGARGESIVGWRF